MESLSAIVGAIKPSKRKMFTKDSVPSPETV
jgi:hypothetical protein